MIQARDLAVVFLLAGLLVGCGSASQGEKAPAPEPAAVRVETAVARRERVPRLLHAVGSLQAAERVPVSADVAGRVVEVAVDLGDAVAAGEVVVRLDDRERRLELEAARAALAQAEARRKLALAKYRRVESLAQTGTAPAEALDEAKAAIRSANADATAARARVELAQKHLEDSRVTSPIAGYVASRSVERGQYVRPGETLLEVVVLDPLEARVTVPERYAAELRPGLPARLRLPGSGLPAIEAQVRRVGPAAQPGTHAVPVELEVPNPGGSLRAGRFVEVDIQLGEADVVVVPREALQSLAGVYRLFIVDADGLVQSRRVEVGADRGAAVEIRSGAAAGERVAVTHLERLADGMRVDVAPGPPENGGGP